MSRLLGAPLRVGPRTLANRIAFTAHLTNQAADGLPTAQHAAYLAARAAGGAGLLITEEHGVDAADRPYEAAIRGWDPAVLEGYRHLTDAVHAHGVPVLAQLTHHGAQGSSVHTGVPLLAPSPRADPAAREVPRALTPADVERLVEGFARVAGRCREGGFDGVEVQASQSSILRQLLSRASNHRTDGLGGAVAGRASVLLQVLVAVRAAIGPDAVLGVRLAADEQVPDGTTVEEAVAVARLVAPHVDLISTAVGVAPLRQDLVTPGMGVPAGYALGVAAAIRQAVAVPVIGVGRFTEPAQAEAALAAGACDLVGVVRAQIADPEWAAKALSGRAVEIRRCLGCNQECVARVGAGRWLGCTANPRAGREAVRVPAPRRAGRRVLVVGGGPAGLRAAVTAAERGHQVTLVERAGTLGGQIPLAASAPGRGELAGLTDHLIHRVAQLAVEVCTGVAADAGVVAAHRPDAVVLATGSRAGRPAWAPTAIERVVDVRHVLDGRALPTGRVLVVDELGFHHATSTALLLAASGCAVTMTTPAMAVGQDLAGTQDLRRFTVGAVASGIVQRTDEVVCRVTVGPEGLAVDLLHHPTGAAAGCTVDWVVAAVQPEPRTGLWVALHADRPPPFEVHRIGDCLAPRRAHAAILEGDRVAVAL